MINRVVLVGRLTRDPERRNKNSDNAVCAFTVAVDNRSKNPDGTRGTSFINCVAFAQQAENMFKYVQKGSLVGVEGRLNQRSFTRQDGSKGSVVEVLCDSVQFLEPKGSNSNGEEVPTFDDTDSNDGNKNLDNLDLPDDDLPF